MPENKQLSPKDYAELQNSLHFEYRSDLHIELAVACHNALKRRQGADELAIGIADTMIAQLYGCFSPYTAEFKLLTMHPGSRNAFNVCAHACQIAALDCLDVIETMCRHGNYDKINLMRKSTQTYFSQELIDKIDNLGSRGHGLSGGRLKLDLNEKGEFLFRETYWEPKS